MSAPPAPHVLRETPPTRLKAEYVGNIDVVFHGRNDEPITLCDVSYIQGLR